MTRDAAVKQIARLSGLRRFPPGEEARRELVNALVAVCPTEERAERLVSELVETCDECPAPAGIRRWAQRYAGEAAQPQGRRGCRDCYGSGWRSVKKPVKVGRLEYEADGAERCACREARV